MAQQFDVSPATLREIVQSLQEMRKMSRSVESSAESFIPFADKQTEEDLKMIMSHAQLITNICTRLYSAIAKEAFRA